MRRIDRLERKLANPDGLPDRILERDGNLYGVYSGIERAVDREALAARIEARMARQSKIGELVINASLSDDVDDGPVLFDLGNVTVDEHLGVHIIVDVTDSIGRDSKQNTGGDEQ